MAFLRIGLMALSLLLAQTGMALADAFKDGFDAWLDGNFQTALHNLKPLAKQGNKGAQFILGQMYSFGNGVPQNEFEGSRWMLLAAKQGHPEAQFAMGVRYENGRGVTQDYRAAALWYSKAAEKGKADALNNLGVLYVTGKGVLQDYVTAHMWFNIASVLEGENAKENLDDLTALLSANQLAEAQRMAREWLAKHQQ